MTPSVGAGLPLFGGRKHGFPWGHLGNNLFDENRLLLLFFLGKGLTKWVTKYNI